MLAIAARLSGMILQLVTTMLLARLLRPSDFGLVAMAGSVTGFFAMFTELGLSQATVQLRTIGQNVISAFFYANLAMGVVVSLLIIALAPVAAWFFGDARLTLIIATLAVTLPVIAAGRQHTAVLQREMRWKAMFGISIVAQALASAVAVAAALTSNIGYWVLVLQVWVSAVLITGLAWVLNPWRPGRVRDWPAIREPLSFGLHLAAFGFLNYFHRQFDNVLVGWRWGSTPLGHYNRAYTLLTMPLQLINGPVELAVLPALSKLQDQPKQWADLYCKALHVTVFCAAPLASVLIIAAQDVVRILFGPGWGMAGEIFKVLAISIYFQPVISSTGWLWISTGQSKRMLKWAMMSIPVIILGMVIGLPYGPKGLALGYSITICVLTPACTWFASRKLPITIPQVYRSIAVPMLSSGGALAISATLFAGREGLVSIILQVLCFGAIYLTATLAFDRDFLKIFKFIAGEIIMRK